MRRRFALIAAMLVAAAGIAMSNVGLAYADTSKQVCTDSGAVCLTVTYHNRTGDTGWDINQIIGACDPGHWQFGWDHPAVDGRYMKLWNNQYTATPTLKWSLSDASSNVDTSGGVCARVMGGDLHYPGADTLRIGWDFIMQKNLQTDVERYLEINICDAQDPC